METYKKRGIILLICLAVVAGCAGILLLSFRKTVSAPNYTPNSNINTIEKTDNLALPLSETEGQTANEPAQPLYTAGIYEGQVALFSPGSDVPQQVLPVYVNHLPPADQQLLEAGLPLYTQEDVASFLEDYGS